MQKTEIIEHLAGQGFKRVLDDEAIMLEKRLNGEMTHDMIQIGIHPTYLSLNWYAWEGSARAEPISRYQEQTPEELTPQIAEKINRLLAARSALMHGATLLQKSNDSYTLPAGEQAWIQTGPISIEIDHQESKTVLLFLAVDGTQKPPYPHLGQIYYTYRNAEKAIKEAACSQS